MKNAKVSGYRRLKQGISVLGIAACLVGTVAGGALADGFDGGKQIGGDKYEYGYSTYSATYDGDLYQYETGKDGYGYYSTYDGKDRFYLACKPDHVISFADEQRSNTDAIKGEESGDVRQ